MVRGQREVSADTHRCILKLAPLSLASPGAGSSVPASAGAGNASVSDLRVMRSVSVRPPCALPPQWSTHHPPSAVLRPTTHPLRPAGTAVRRRVRSNPWGAGGH